MSRDRTRARPDAFPADGHRLLTIAIGVAMITAVVYLPALRNGFVNWDDPQYVYQRPEIQRFDAQFLSWAMRSFTHGTWHPLTWLSLAFDHRVWELRPLGYHATNVILHAMNAGVAVVVMAALFRKDAGRLDGAHLFACALVGLLFGVHPLHVEPVAWISSRKDVLYGLFWLLATLAYLRFATAEHARARKHAYGLCLALFACALMSKPMAITFPVVLLMLDWYPLRRLPAARPALRPVLAEKVPFFLLSAGVAWLTYRAASDAAALGAMTQSTVAGRTLSGIRTLGAFLTRTAVPVRLLPYYPFQPDVSWLAGSSLAALALIILITAAAWRLRRRAPIVATAWMYFVATLGPILGVVQFGSHAGADRYMYLPLLGPLVLAGVGGAAAWRRWAAGRQTLTLLTILLVFVMALLTREQIGIWRDSITLWEYVVARTPPDAKPLYNLGNAYKDAGNMAAAGNAWGRVLEIAPNHSLALNQRGNLALLSGQLQDARRYYERAVAADPINAEAQYNLAVTLERLGDVNAARRAYERFLEVAPAEYAGVAAQVRMKLSR